MKTLIKALFIVLLFNFFACGGNDSGEQVPETSDSTAAETPVTTTEHTDPVPDTTETANTDTTGTEGIATEPEEITEEKIVEETGMSFCDCVKKQKEIQKRIDESEDDEELMQLMQEMNNLRNGDCKVLFIQDQTSVDQIEERKKRIAACK